ncbi:MAG: phosphoglycerate mutase family protein [Lachnospiraceae bacterium]|nr:phosphoglycerate mutase family protein [Lachnospiraceae bacterium]
MTTFSFIRYGKTDFSEADSKIYRGQGFNMLTLSDEGINQIIETAKTPELTNAKLIVTSPFGRALHSAAILSEKLQLDIKVETNLHEWQANIQTFEYLSDEEANKNYEELSRYHGEPPQNKICVWETAEQMKKRVYAVLEKYKQYSAVIIVCHGTLMQYALDIPHPENGEIVKFVL